MSKRGPRFSEKEKLAILKEGEGNDVNAVCAQYGMSDQTWRYKAHGARPRKQLLRKEQAQDSGRGRSERYLPDLCR
jgi:hypothetical protein